LTWHAFACSRRVHSAIRALLSNPAVVLEFHLQQLMPAVFTCVVAAKLCGSPDEVQQTPQAFCAVRHLCIGFLAMKCNAMRCLLRSY
jgi:hypothetical protein